MRKVDLPKERERPNPMIVKGFEILVGHSRYRSRGIEGVCGTGMFPLVLELMPECDGVKVLTWARSRPNDHGNRNTKVQGENTVQYCCNPFVLPSDGVGSGAVRMSEHCPINQEN